MKEQSGDIFIKEIFCDKWGSWFFLDCFSSIKSKRFLEKLI